MSRLFICTLSGSPLTLNRPRIGFHDIRSGLNEDLQLYRGMHVGELSRWLVGIRFFPEYDT